MAFQSKTRWVAEARISRYEYGPMTGPAVPKGPLLPNFSNPRASRLVFCTSSVTEPLMFGSKSLSFCHFSPRASMVLYSDKSPARFCRKARSIASWKVNCKTPGVGFASGTLPNTGFCAEVCTWMGALELELCAQSTPEKPILAIKDEAIRKIAALFIVINQIVRFYPSRFHRRKPPTTKKQPARQPTVQSRERFSAGVGHRGSNRQN